MMDQNLTHERYHLLFKNFLKLPLTLPLWFILKFILYLKQNYPNNSLNKPILKIFYKFHSQIVYTKIYFILKKTLIIHYFNKRLKLCFERSESSLTLEGSESNSKRYWNR